LKAVVIPFNLMTSFFTRAKRGNIRKEVSEKGPNPVTFEYVFFCKMNTIIIILPQELLFVASNVSFKEQLTDILKN